MTWLCAWQSDRRVVVTGMGIVSCLGNSQDEVADSLHKAKAGIKFSEKYKEIGVPAVLTGQEGRRSTRAGHPRASVRARGAGQRAPGPPHAVRMPHARRPRESTVRAQCRAGVGRFVPRHPGMKSHICGTPDINCDDFIDRKQARFMGLNAKYAYIAMQQAGQLTTTLTLTLSLILTLTLALSLALTLTLTLTLTLNRRSRTRA